MTTPKQEPISLPDLTKLVEEHRWFEVSVRYFEAHVEEFLEQYRDRWIGIHHGVLVADAPSLDMLFRELDDRGVPKQFTFVRRMWQSGLPLVT